MGQTFHQPSEDEIKNVFAQRRNGKSEVGKMACIASRLHFGRINFNEARDMMKMEEAPESSKPQDSIEYREKLRSFLKPCPAEAINISAIKDANDKLEYYNQLFDVVRESNNWRFFFTTHHQLLDEHYMRRAMVDGLLRAISERIDACSKELHRLGVALTRADAHSVVIQAELAAEKRGQEIAERNMGALRAEIADLGRKLVAAEDARKQAETKARSAAGKAAAAKRASKKAAPKRKPASKPARKRR